MANLMTMVDERLKTKMRWYDISLTKLAVLFFTLALVGAFPVIAESLDWRVFYVLSFIVALPAVLRIFSELWVRTFYIIWYGLIYLAIYYFA